MDRDQLDQVASTPQTRKSEIRGLEPEPTRGLGPLTTALQDLWGMPTGVAGPEAGGPLARWCGRYGHCRQVFMDRLMDRLPTVDRRREGRQALYATIWPRRWRFLATEPGRTMKWICPSSSTATTRTTACAAALPASSMAPGRIRAGSRASASVDHPCPSSSSAFRSATRSTSTMGRHFLSSSFMVRVSDGLMLAADQPAYTVLELVESDVEVPRVAAGSLQSQAG